MEEGEESEEKSIGKDRDRFCDEKRVGTYAIEVVVDDLKISIANIFN